MKHGKLVSLALVLPLALALTATTASAKNVCVQTSGFVNLVFFKVKPLNAPGKYTALNGVASPNCPVTGTAYTDKNNLTHFDVRIGCLPETGIALHYGWTGSGATYSGSGKIDSNGDGTPDGDRTFTGITCTTLSLPLAAVRASDTQP
jgi:hypothetical protein